MNKKIILPFASLLLCGVLFLIWPTAHTIALRKLLLVVGALLGITLWIRDDVRNEIIKQRWLIILTLLFIWVIFHAGFVSQNGTEAWKEFLGQWLPAYLALFSGIGVAVAGRTINASVYKIYLLAVLSVQPVLYLYLSIYKSIQLGHIATGFMVVNWGADLKPSLTFSSDMLAALACAKLLESFITGKQNNYKYLWILSIVLALYIAMFTETLNSILLIGACVIIMLALLGYSQKSMRTRICVVFSILIVMTAIFVTSFLIKYPSYLESKVSNTKVALDIDKYQNWTNFYSLGLPSNELGEQLPESFYLHVTYARAGLRAVLENPWGYGVTRHAFERLIQQKYPDARIASTHNGYLDLACAVGIPGLLLFVLALIAIFKQLSQSRSEFARPAMWMIAMYALHWMLDPLSRDHFFELYLFIIALMMTLTLNTTPQNTIPDNQGKAL